MNHHSEQLDSGLNARFTDHRPVDSLGRQASIEFPASHRGRKIHVTPHGRVHEVSGRKTGWGVVTAVGVAATLATLAVINHNSGPVNPNGFHDPGMDKLSGQQVEGLAEQNMLNDQVSRPSTGRWQYGTDYR